MKTLLSILIFTFTYISFVSANVNPFVDNVEQLISVKEIDSDPLKFNIKNMERNYVFLQKYSSKNSVLKSKSDQKWINERLSILFAMSQKDQFFVATECFSALANRKLITVADAKIFKSMLKDDLTNEFAIKVLKSHKFETKDSYQIAFAIAENLLKEASDDSQNASNRSIGSSVGTIIGAGVGAVAGGIGGAITGGVAGAGAGATGGGAIGGAGAVPGAIAGGILGVIGGGITGVGVGAAGGAATGGAIGGALEDILVGDDDDKKENDDSTAAGVVAGADGRDCQGFPWVLESDIEFPGL